MKSYTAIPFHSLLIFILTFVYTSLSWSGNNEVFINQTRFSISGKIPPFLQANFACGYCKHLLKDPIIDVTSARACRSCVSVLRETMLSQSLDSPPAPTQENIEASKLTEKFPENPQILVYADSLREKIQENPQNADLSLTREDTAFKEHLNKVIVVCQDCSQEVLYGEAENHAELHVIKCSCGFVPDTGKVIDERMQQLTQHKQNRVQCENCDSMVSCNQMNTHKAICSGRESECPFPACSEMMSGKDLIQHVTISHHQNDSLQCAVCGDTLSPGTYAFHYLIQHGLLQSDGSIPVCPYCNAGYKDMLQHLFGTHAEQVFPCCCQYPQQVSSLIRQTLRILMYCCF